MNLVNLSTAIHRVAKIAGSDPWQQAGLHGCHAARAGTFVCSHAAAKGRNHMRVVRNPVSLIAQKRTIT